MGELGDKFEIGNKAAYLMEYTITITSNKKRYPPKYRMLIERIQRLSFDIYEFVIDANRINLKTSLVERNRLQTKAITACDKLSKFCELSVKLKLIGSDTLCAWQKKICDVKYMTIAWRNKEEK